jgi:hypothetical protein
MRQADRQIGDRKSCSACRMHACISALICTHLVSLVFNVATSSNRRELLSAESERPRVTYELGFDGETIYVSACKVIKPCKQLYSQNSFEIAMGESRLSLKITELSHI